MPKNSKKGKRPVFNSRQTKAIKSIASTIPETKVYEKYSTDETSVLGVDTWVLDVLNSVPQGTDADEYVGEKFRERGVALHVQPRTASGYNDIMYRLVVFRYLGSSNTPLVDAKFLLETEYLKRFDPNVFDILLDKTYSTHVFNATSGDSVRRPIHKHWIKLGKTVKMSSSTVPERPSTLYLAVTSFDKNGTYGSSEASIKWQSYYYFKDA